MEDEKERKKMEKKKQTKRIEFNENKMTTSVDTLF